MLNNIKKEQIKKKYESTINIKIFNNGFECSAAASAGSSPRRAVIEKANSTENKRVEILATDILNEQARLE